MLTLKSESADSLSGYITLPGDKSISHRALILGALAMGKTRISGLLEGADVMSTLSALIQLGTTITRDEDANWVVDGLGLGGFIAPTAPLDLGNAGTGVRLLMGAVAGGGISAVFTGDASLSARPMARVTDPLATMGARVEARDGTYLPITISAPDQPPSPQLMAIRYESPIASAQIKSAVLLAGLTARGETTVIEPKASRDHTEAMLRHFGAVVVSEEDDDGRHCVRIVGEALLTAKDIIVPADPSSAAFLAVAALITKNSSVTLRGVGTNPLRFGVFETLKDMGGDIILSNKRVEGGETVADLIVRSSTLMGITVPSRRAASMIDEYPILCIAAASATGITHMGGIEELRVKETDRIQLMADGLVAAGVTVDTTQDSMTVHGVGGGMDGGIGGGITIDACHDHRIAMSFLTLGLITAKPMVVSGAETIATSFPNFAELMTTAGANISQVAP